MTDLILHNIKKLETTFCHTFWETLVETYTSHAVKIDNVTYYCANNIVLHLQKIISPHLCLYLLVLWINADWSWIWTRNVLDLDDACFYY